MNGDIEVRGVGRGGFTKWERPPMHATRLFGFQVLVYLDGLSGIAVHVL